MVCSRLGTGKTRRDVSVIKLDLGPKLPQWLVYPPANHNRQATFEWPDVGMGKGRSECRRTIEVKTLSAIAIDIDQDLATPALRSPEVVLIVTADDRRQTVIGAEEFQRRRLAVVLRINDRLRALLRR